jgi:hypothetical protein
MASIIITRHLPSVSPRTIHGTGGTADGTVMIHSGAEPTIPPFMQAGITGIHPCSTTTHTMATTIIQPLVVEDSAEPHGLLAQRVVPVLCALEGGMKWAHGAVHLGQLIYRQVTGLRRRRVAIHPQPRRGFHQEEVAIADPVAGQEEIAGFEEETREGQVERQLVLRLREPTRHHRETAAATVVVQADHILHRRRLHLSRVHHPVAMEDRRAQAVAHVVVEAGSSTV